MSAIREQKMYCVYGNTGTSNGGTLYRGGPLLGGSVIGGSTEVSYTLYKLQCPQFLLSRNESAAGVSKACVVCC